MSGGPEDIAVAPPEALFTLVSDRWTAPFWEAAREERLAIPRCPACGAWRMPPTPFCPACQTHGIAWEEVAQTGVLYSWTVVARAPDPSWRVPWVPAVVSLPQAGGVRLVSNVVDAPVGSLCPDMALRVVWDRRRDGVTVPRFTPA
jgi:uncharacterized OB-fold protein